ncbi:MAG: cellulose biosynthesis cyclic di-GMP-binding regulatory protein BcsB [Deltaproteobacteria bacterium]
MKRTITTALTVVLCLLLFNISAKAAATREKGTAREYILKLSDIVKLDAIDKEEQINLKADQINLITASAGFQFSLPIPKRINIQQAVLHLDFTHSNALLKNRSQLRVEVNGIVVSQIALDPQGSHVIADIPVPGEFMRPGYNKVKLKVAQHYTEKCEDPTASELWTQVNTIKSYFHFVYHYSAANFTLANLDDLFDKKLFDYRLTVMRPDVAAQYNDNDLLWGALASQGVSLRLEYKPVTLDLGIAKLKDAPEMKHPELSDDPLFGLDQSELRHDAILIGTVGELRSFFHPHKREAIANAISGPYLALFQAADPRFSILIISGRNEEEVTRAATAFTLNRFPFPDDRSMVVKEIAVPPIAANIMPQILQPGIRYAFKDLGFQSVTDVSYQRSEVQFKVPPDLLPREKTNVIFKLDMAYGAGFRKDSVLNIYLNGLFEKAIALDNKMGARFNDSGFYMPVTDLQPGLNTLHFMPVIPPLAGDECMPPPTDNAVVTIFDSSSIELPLLDHYVKLPDFRLFNRTGFPYLKEAAGAGMGILVRGKKDGSILAAWQILGKLTQIAATPLYDVQISFDRITDRNFIIVGDRSSLHPEDLGNAPVQLGDSLRFDYPINKGSNNVASGLIGKLKSLADPILPDRVGTLQPVYATLAFKSSLGKDSLLVGYESATAPGKLTMLLTNEDSKQLQAGARRLIDPDFWNVLQGNLAAWNTDDYSLQTNRTPAEFFVGQTSASNSLAYFYSIHRTLFLAAVGFLILACAWFAYFFTKRYHRGNDSDVSELES